MNSPDFPNWSSKTYLVIDDFSIVHRMLRDMLRKIGAQHIDVVKNGPDAIALLKAKPYDVVLCDYNFSEGPNGQQILEEARHLDLVGLATIWMMVSSEKAIETVMGAAEQAPDGYILKPVTESLLLARLNRAWDRKQAFKPIDRAYAKRNYREAARLCDEQFAANPLHRADLLRMKASLLLRANDLAGARQVYEQALAMRDQVWAKTGLARIHRAKGDNAAAKWLLMDVINGNPSYLDAYDLLAEVLHDSGELEQAAVVLEQAAQLSPYAVLRQQRLGDLARQLGRLEQAEAAYRMALEVGANSVMKAPDAYLGLAQVYSMLKRPDEALAVLDDARQIFAEDQTRTRAAILQGRILAECGQADRARQIAQGCRQLLDSRAGDGAARDQLAQLLAMLGEPQTAPVPAANGAGGNQAQPDIPSQPIENDFFSLIDTEKLKPAPQPAAPRQPAPASAASAPVQGTAPIAEGEIDVKAAALFQRAQVLIQYMQRTGYNAVTGEEVRAVLARAEKLAPAHPRSREILAALNHVKAARP